MARSRALDSKALKVSGYLPRVLLLVALAALSLALFSPASASPSGKARVIITFERPPGAQEEALVRQAGGEIRHSFDILPALAVEVPASAIEGLRHNPWVSAVEEDHSVYAFDAELDNSWGVKRIGAGIVHNGNKGSGVKVAVLDTGIGYNHTDLDGNYAGGHDFVNGDADPLDDHGHGTLVAGVIAAEDNAAGVVGVAPGAQLYALKVLDYRGIGYESDVMAALQWSVDNGMQVVNMSFGASAASSAFGEAISNAYDAGIVLVAAAGNSGRCNGKGNNVLFPARFAAVVAVAATDSLDDRPCWSSTGPDVELGSPGVAITTTAADGSYRSVSGTSVASPHVAGTAALVLASGNLTDEDNDGDIDSADARLRLQVTAEGIGLPSTWVGYGLVDAEAATGPATASPPPEPDTTAPAAPAGLEVTASASQSGTLNLDWANNAEADLAGYNVYRSATSDGPYAPVASLVATSAYTEGDLVNGTLYYYVVTAVDTSSNESELSIEASATPVPVSAPLIHVASIEVTVKKKGSLYDAQAKVTIVDASGTPVEGTTVTGKWTMPDGSTLNESGTTNGKGQVRSSTGRVEASSGQTFTFEVTDVFKDGATYDPGANTTINQSAAIP